MNKIITVISIVFISVSCFAQTISSFPYQTGFEGIEGNLHANYPEGWTSEDLNTNTSGNQNWQIIKNSDSYTNARTDSTAIHMLSNMTQVNNDWLYTPGIEMSAGATYTLSFWYNTIDFGGTSEKLKIHIGNDAVSTAMSVDALWDNNFSNLEYQEATLEFTPTVDGIYYFGFHYYSDDFQYILLIDDITISESSTSKPSATIASSATFFPNPCNANLSISIPKDELANSQVIVYNSIGKMVISKSVTEESFSINTANLKHGIYTIQVLNNDKQIISEKIIVRH